MCGLLYLCSQGYQVTVGQLQNGEVDFVAEHEETVGEAAWDEELPFVLTRQLHHDVLAEGGT